MMMMTKSGEVPRVVPVLHDVHESGQDTRVVLALNGGAEVGEHLAEGVAGRPSHARVGVGEVGQDHAVWEKKMGKLDVHLRKTKKKA